TIALLLVPWWAATADQPRDRRISEVEEEDGPVVSHNKYVFVCDISTHRLAQPHREIVWSGQQLRFGAKIPVTATVSELRNGKMRLEVLVDKRIRVSKTTILDHPEFVDAMGPPLFRIKLSVRFAEAKFGEE